jgi:sulfonate transport system substrate-binding protein
MARRAFYALFPFALLVVLAVSVSAFGAEKAALRLSGWKLPFNVPVIIELDRGTYAKAFPEFDISVVNMQTGPQLMAAMAAGEIDIVQGIGDAAFLVAAAGGVDAKIIAASSRSPKAFAVVAGDGVSGIVGLKGKKVAGLRGSVVHQVFVSALAEAGLSEADVEFFPMPVAQAASTLLAGRVDAALLVGGEILRATKAGAKVIADGDGRVEGLSLVVASSRFIADHPDAPDAFRVMREGTLAFMKANPSLAIAAAATDTGLAQTEVESMMGWYDFDAAIRPSDRQSLSSTLKYLLEQKLASKEIDVDSLVLRLSD